MDLISREAAIKFAKEQMVKESGAYSKGLNAALLVMKSALNNLDAIPTVPAVPLDKLCEWLARNAFAFECEDCNEYCRALLDCENEVGSDPKYWKNKLTK